MEICYLWVENFRNFQNQGFNFFSSSKFHFDLDSMELKKEELKPLPEAFFSNAVPVYDSNKNYNGLSEVTGLIGRNGSGKSNVLDALLKSIKGAKSTMDCNFLLITHDHGKFTCYLSFDLFIEKNISHDFPIKFVEYDGSIPDLKAIFFSNIYDERDTYFSNDISDISVNRIAKNRFSSRKEKSSFEKQILFLKSKHFDYLDIEEPQKVLIGSRIWNHGFNSRRRRYTSVEQEEKLKEFSRMIRSRIRDIVPKNRFPYILQYSVIWNCIDTLIVSTDEAWDPIELDELFNILLSGNRTSDTLEEGLKWSLNKFQDYNDEIKDSLDREKSRGQRGYEDPQVLIDKIRLALSDDIYSENLRYEPYTEGKRRGSIEYFAFDYHDKKSKSFIQRFSEIFSDDSYFDLKWLGISSGHLAYINMFAALYDEIKYQRSENLLICIDEGDLYLHPKWQTEFFDKLVTLLPRMYSKNIQLIITSHSPFILSDLPKQCVTIIEPSFPNQGVTDGYLLDQNTFAGNIYTLYQEPFFLEKKRMSDFSASKVNQITSKLKSNRLKSSELRELDDLINLIGDKVLHMHLQKIRKDD